MKKKNIKKRLLYVLVLILIFCATLFFLSDVIKPKLSINDLEELPIALFDDVYLAEVGTKDQSYSCIYQKDINEVIRIVKNIEVYEKTMKDAEFTYEEASSYIFLRKENGGYIKLFLGDNNKTIWLDYGDSFSYRSNVASTNNTTQVYKITTKDTFEVLFESLRPYFDETLYDNSYIDGRLFEVGENEIVIKEERLETNVYLKENWLNNLGNEYTVQISTSYNNKMLFQEGDKVRIKLKDSSSKESPIITEDQIYSIYYLNEILYIKDINYGNTNYFTEEEVLLAMDSTMENIYTDTQQLDAVFYMYCNDQDSIDAEAYIQNMREDYVLDIENQLFVFFKILPSRAMQGSDAKDNMHKCGKYGLGGFSSFERHNIEYLKNKKKTP